MIEIPLTTQRLTIRRFEPADLDAYLRFMLDEESTRYLAFTPEQKTSAGATALFEYVRQAYDTTAPVHAYAIADILTDEYRGSCGLAPYEERVWECYYCVNPEFRGCGFAAEATTALLAAMPSDIQVRAYCHPQNKAAHVVAKKCGMKHAGRARHRESGLEGEMFVFGETLPG